MARVSIVIEDAGEVDGRGQVNIWLESDPPLALDGRKPLLEEWTPAQSAAYLALENVIGGAGAAEMIVVNEDDIQPN